MIVRSVSLLAVAVLAISHLDVMPSCGKREPHYAEPGYSCGGPFICNAPATCATLDRSIVMPNYSSTYVCTKSCATDADCTGLGMEMTCTGQGYFGASSDKHERMCIPTSAKDAGAM
jgi:hypothetical protein